MHTDNNPFAPEAFDLVIQPRLIRKPRVARRKYWRTEGEPFDPAKVAKVGLVAVTEPTKPAIS